MGASIDVEATDSAALLELVANRAGAGPAVGLTPKARVREVRGTADPRPQTAYEIPSPEVSPRYLDFADLVFKSEGWARMEIPLREASPGVYQAFLDVSKIESLEIGDRLAVEYVITSPPDAPCDRSVDVDVFTIVSEKRRRPLRHVAEPRSRVPFSWEADQAELEMVAGVPARQADRRTGGQGRVGQASSTNAGVIAFGLLAAMAIGVVALSAKR